MSICCFSELVLIDTKYCFSFGFWIMKTLLIASLVSHSHMPDWPHCFSLFFSSLRLLRSWRSDLCKGSCALVCVSVEHDDSPRMAAVRGVVLESQYLLEPCGTGRTRLTHISRVDLRCGKTSSVLTLKGLNHHCDHNMHSLLFSLQGTVPRMVQQGFWPPVC